MLIKKKTNLRVIFTKPNLRTSSPAPSWAKFEQKGEKFEQKGEKMSTNVLQPLWPTSHSSMVWGGTAVRTRSSTGTAWINTNSSGGGKKGSSFWPKFNSTTQFLQRTWGRRARSARDSLLIRNATPRPSPFLEKESSTSSASKFYNKDKSIYRHTGLAVD